MRHASPKDPNVSMLVTSTSSLFARDEPRNESPTWSSLVTESLQKRASIDETEAWFTEADYRARARRRHGLTLRRDGRSGRWRRKGADGRVTLGLNRSRIIIFQPKHASSESNSSVSGRWANGDALFSEPLGIC